MEHCLPEGAARIRADNAAARKGCVAGWLLPPSPYMGVSVHPHPLQHPVAVTSGAALGQEKCALLFVLSLLMMI